MEGEEARPASAEADKAQNTITAAALETGPAPNTVEMRLVAAGWAEAKRAPSIDLVPIKKKQILVDGDIADVIKRVAAALGYKSMSGLLNDALVHYLRAEYPDMNLTFVATATWSAGEP